MDPLSFAACVAGLLGLAASTISLATSHLASQTGKKDSIRALIVELESLHSNLASLDRFLQSSSASAAGLAFEHTSVLRSCTSACEKRLQILRKKLGKTDSNKFSRFLWPLSEAEYQKAIQELRSFSHWIHFALTVDGCVLLSQTSERALELMSGQLKVFTAINSMEEKLNQLQDTTRDQTLLLGDERKARENALVLDWISTTDSSQKHEFLQSLRIPEARDWLLNRPEFLQWYDGTAPSSVLWCPGVQGSGKTVLT